MGANAAFVPLYYPARKPQRWYRTSWLPVAATLLLYLSFMLFVKLTWKPVKVKQQFFDENAAEEAKERARLAGQEDRLRKAVIAARTRRRTRIFMKILFIHYFYPYLRVGSDRRLLDVMTEFVSQGHEVHVLGRDEWYENDFHREIDATLDSIGIKHHMGWESWNTKLETYMKQEQFDVVFTLMWFWTGINRDIPNDFIPAINRFNLTCPPVFALMADDVNYEREKSISFWETDSVKRGMCLNRSADMESREVNAWKLNDVVFAVTPEDQKVIMRRLPEAKVGTLLHALRARPSEIGTKPVAPYTERKDIIFVGNGANPTNSLSMAWFLQHVLPVLQKELPGVEVKIAGRAPADVNWAGSKNVQEYPPGVEQLSFVPDLDALMNSSRLFVSPIMMGTGVNTKNLDALSAGLPLVTSLKGTAGYGVDRNGRFQGSQVMLVANDIPTFVARIKAAYTNETLWNELSHNSRFYAKHNLSGSLMAKEVRRAQRVLVKLLRTRRCASTL